MKRVAKIVNSGYAHKRGYFGQNVTVAVVDSGIAVHRDFCSPPGPPAYAGFARRR